MEKDDTLVITRSITQHRINSAQGSLMEVS